MYREAAGALISTYMSSVTHRSNEIMKVLTMMSSIFVPLTFIAGIYGMNFEHMLELSHPWFYPIALGVMLATAGAMAVFFFRSFLTASVPGFRCQKINFRGCGDFAD